MAKKIEKKVSINALEKVAKEQFPESTVSEWFDIEVVVKRTLPLQEMLQFVKEVVDVCFLEDGTYVPEIMEFAIKSGVLTHYANFTLPSNLDKQYWLIYSTGAVDHVIQYINMQQLQEIIASVHRKIEQMCDADIVATRARVGELYTAFNKMGEQFANVFGGLSAEDILKVASAVGEHGLSEEKIVAAYINQMKKAAEHDK